jgi:glycosyltransferase involved in cell wall biosynthesis
MKDPKYSILIPTRNGFKYLPFAVDSVLSQPSNDFELIVSVNHSSDGTWQYLESLSDTRLTLVQPEKELSMSRNFEFLLSHAKGDWITFLGDDDALMPYFFEEADNLISKHPDIKSISSRRAYYFWNGCQDVYGSTIVSYTAQRKSYLKNSKLQAFLVLLSFVSYMELPQTYTTGLFHCSLIQEIKSLSGGIFFHSITPDAYSSMVGTLRSKNYLRTELPLFWVGSSPKSNGFSHIFRNGKNSGKSNNLFKVADDFHKLAQKDNLTINSRVSKELFTTGGFSALYFYEALICCPFAKGFWQSKLLEHMVYGGMLCQLLNRSILMSSTQREKIFVFFEECRLLNLNILSITCLSIPIKLAFLFFKLALFSRKLVIAVFEPFSQMRFRKLISNQGEDFLDMTYASKAVISLWNETHQTPK